MTEGHGSRFVKRRGGLKIDNLNPPEQVRATRPARALAWTVAAQPPLGAIGVAVIVVLEVFVFGPRRMMIAILLGGIIGCALLVTWLGAGERWRPR